MGRKELCDLGRQIEHRLIDLHQSDKWLIGEVRAASGKYFDRSYLHKIKTGELAPAGMISSICRILGIPDESA